MTRRLHDRAAMRLLVSAVMLSVLPGICAAAPDYRKFVSKGTMQAARVSEEYFDNGPDRDPFVLDSSKDADVCIHRAVHYDLWRPSESRSKEESYALQGVEGTKQKAVLTFSRDQARAGIPDDFNFNDGARYEIIGPSSHATIVVHMIDETAPSASQATIDWFKKLHCDRQAGALAQFLASLKK